MTPFPTTETLKVLVDRIRNNLHLKDSLYEVEQILNHAEDAFLLDLSKPENRLLIRTAQKIAEGFLTSISPFLFTNGLLEKAYAISPVPDVFDSYIISVFQPDARRFAEAMIQKMVDLGGCPSYNSIRLCRADALRSLLPNNNICAGLVRNIAANADNFGFLDENNKYVTQVFMLNLLSSMIKQRPEETEKIIRENGYFISQLSGDNNDIKKPHNFLFKVFSQAPSSRFLNALKDNDPKVYSAILNDSKVLESIKRDVFANDSHINLASLLDHPCFDSEFLLDLFVMGVSQCWMPENMFTVLEKRWKDIGNTESLATAGLRNEEIIRAIKLHEVYVDFLNHPELDVNVFKNGWRNFFSNIDPATRFGELVNQYLKLTHSNKIYDFTFISLLNDVSVLEKLYVPVDQRISSSEESRIAHLMYAIHKADAATLLTIAEGSKSDLCVPEVTYSLVSIYLENRSNERAGSFSTLIDHMVLNWNQANAFSSISIDTYKLLFGSKDDKFRAHLRNVRWKDPQIRKHLISTDMEI